MSIKSKIKKHTPWPILYLYRKIYYFPKDISAASVFAFNSTKSPTTFGERVRLVFRFYRISYAVNCPHTENEFLSIAKQILDLGPKVEGAIVEAGAFHGGSTSKLSLIAALCGRELMVFDSFEGMPANDEPHGKSIYGREHHFPKGSHAVSLSTVKKNIEKYGEIDRCTFYKGWFSETMADFNEPVAAACINVDLLQSTKDCLRSLYPLTKPGGIIISQDAHFPWIITLLEDDSFWRKEIGVAKPKMKGLGSSKFVTIFI